MRKCPGTGQPSIERGKHNLNAQCPYCGKCVKGRAGHRTPPHKTWNK